jgi:hypothetical protein
MHRDGLSHTKKMLADKGVNSTVVSSCCSMFRNQGIPVVVGFHVYCSCCRSSKTPRVNALQQNSRGTRNQADWLAPSEVHQNCLLLQNTGNSPCAIRCELSSCTPKDNCNPGNIGKGVVAVGASGKAIFLLQPSYEDKSIKPE